MWMLDHLPEVRVIVNGRFPQERNITTFRGLPKREVEGEDFRGAQTISHPCSELQASQVLPAVLITYFSLFRISDNASALCLFNFYPKLILVGFVFFFLSRWKISNDQWEGPILAHGPEKRAGSPGQSRDPGQARVGTALAAWRCWLSFWRFLPRKLLLHCKKREERGGSTFLKT